MLGGGTAGRDGLKVSADVAAGRDQQVSAGQDRGDQQGALRRILVHLRRDQLDELDSALRVPDQHHTAAGVFVIQIVVPGGGHVLPSQGAGGRWDRLAGQRQRDTTQRDLPVGGDE